MKAIRRSKPDIIYRENISQTELIKKDRSKGKNQSILGSRGEPKPSAFPGNSILAAQGKAPNKTLKLFEELSLYATLRFSPMDVQRLPIGSLRYYRG